MHSNFNRPEFNYKFLHICEYSKKTDPSETNHTETTSAAYFFVELQIDYLRAIVSLRSELVGSRGGTAWIVLKKIGSKHPMCQKIQNVTILIPFRVH